MDTQLPIPFVNFGFSKFVKLPSFLGLFLGAFKNSTENMMVASKSKFNNQYQKVKTDLIEFGI